MKTTITTLLLCILMGAQAQKAWKKQTNLMESPAKITFTEGMHKNGESFKYIIYHIDDSRFDFIPASSNIYFQTAAEIDVAIQNIQKAIQNVGSDADIRWPLVNDHEVINFSAQPKMICFYSTEGAHFLKPKQATKVIALLQENKNLLN